MIGGWYPPYGDPVGATIRSQRPILMFGGDHPYTQWYNNGGDGRGAIFAKRGIPAYISVNTDDPNGEYVGGTGRATWDQLKAMQALGHEITSHGARHFSSWARANTGITIKYIGAGSAATLTINTSKLLTTAITGGPGGETLSLDLTLAAYDTVDELVTAINATNGGGVYSARKAPELLGTELTKWFMTITAVNIHSSITGSSNVTVARVSANPLTGRNLGISGGILIQYNGTVFRTASFRKTSGNFLELYEDGVCVVQRDLTNASYDTLSEVVTDINSRTGWLAQLCDNGYADNPSDGTAANNFCGGSELSRDIRNCDLVECTNRWMRLELGLPLSYVIDRNLQRAVDVAAANGVTLVGFQQAGADFYPWLVGGRMQHPHFRGDPFMRSSIWPLQQMCIDLHNGGHYMHKNCNVSMVYGKWKATIDAMIDSGPWHVCILSHKVTPDKYSGYTLPAIAGTDDSTETIEVQFLDYIKAKKEAGLLDVMTPSKAIEASRLRGAPQNLLFNPLFRNSGEGIDGLASDGERMPGWLLRTTGAGATVDDTYHTISVVGTAGQLLPITQDIRLEPGQTYEMGFMVEFMGGGTVTNGARIGMQVRRGRWKDSRPAASSTITQNYVKQSGLVTMRFTLPTRKEGIKPFVRSNLSEPFNLSVNNKIRVNYDGLGNTADIDISTGGASAAASRTAYDIANKINSSVLADATYLTKPEYATCARAENGKVIIETPYRPLSGPGSGIACQVLDGTATGALTTVFGAAAAAASCLGEAWHADAAQSHEHYFFWYIEVNNCLSETVRISRPYVEVARFT